jgi:membrane protease YdiL (CAAX protease family)
MALSAMFGYGLYAPHWTKLVLVIVCSLLAVAIWQIVRDRAPLMLDPVERPVPRIALSDGLIAVLGFVVVQTAVGAIAVRARATGAHVLLLAFIIAGGVVALLSLLQFWRRGVPDLLATVGIRAPAGATSPLASIAVGIALGAGAGAIGIMYKRVLGVEQGELPTAIAVLAIAAAPMFEEYIFRGLVFRGLRRSTGAGLAIFASAAIFAIVHPPLSFVPVFVLGAAAAWGFERTGRLLTPIVTHAVYNTIVLFVLF